MSHAKRCIYGMKKRLSSGRPLHSRLLPWPPIWRATAPGTRSSSTTVTACASGYGCFTPPDAPLKILQLHLETPGTGRGRITATYYVEWVLGVSRDGSQQYLIPEFNSDPQALLVRNRIIPSSRACGLRFSQQPLHGLTRRPDGVPRSAGQLEGRAALKRIGLAGTVEAGLDPWRRSTTPHRYPAWRFRTNLLRAGPGRGPGCRPGFGTPLPGPTASADCLGVQ